jgi:UDP-N-acetylmuramate dehydrogenase
MTNDLPSQSPAIAADEPLSRHTTLGVGGPAERLCQPCSAAELVQALAVARGRGWRVCVIGNGSNLLVHDRGVRGLVVKISHRLDEFVVSNDVVVVGAGYPLSGVVDRACREGLFDLSFCAGIPGTCGGAVWMNAGTHDGEISDKMAWADVLDPTTGDIARRTPEALGFAYRTSILQSEVGIVLRVAFHLEDGDPAQWSAKAEAAIARRRERHPRRTRCAGSFFRNPPGRFAAVLIDQAGLKSTRIGDAMVSPIHANFLVNAGKATSAEFTQLIQLVRERVLDTAGVQLQLEVQLVGFPDEERTLLSQ